MQLLHAFVHYRTMSRGSLLADLRREFLQEQNQLRAQSVRAEHEMATVEASCVTQINRVEDEVAVSEQKTARAEKVK